MQRTIAVLFALTASLANGQNREAGRINQHRVANRASPAQEPGAEGQPIPSLIEGLRSADEWNRVRRPQLLRLWTAILGKLDPDEQDRKWFGDIRQAVIRDTADRGTYTRIALDLPIETDFLQHHLLLLPKGPGPFPAVICWTETAPDYTAPEAWWGKWLVEHGYVVLTSWSFIRHYRGDTTYSSGAADKLYERFGHWLPMAKMAHDARREAEYLRSRKEVDGARIGFMGFSLGAKAAVYVGAFAPEIAATVAVDPHIAVNGGTNWFAPWYLDWLRPFPDIPTPQHTVLSLLNPDAARPGFEHDHDELLALAAPRPFLLIGGRRDSEYSGGDSDDLQSYGYYNRAKEVYRLLGVPDRLRFVLTTNGHKPNGPEVDPEWRAFFDRWLRPAPAPMPQTDLRYLEEGLARVDAGLAAHPGAGLKELEQEPGWRHFPSAVLAAAVVEEGHPDRETRERALATAIRIGDLLVREHQTGYYASRLDHHRDTYMWLEAYRLLQGRLGEDRTKWRQALMEEIAAIAQDVARLQDYPLYQSPFIGTSPNHFSLWSSTVYLGSKVFGQPEWERVSAKVLRRFAAEEQSPDGYWGEHSAAGPTTGYDYLTSTAIAVYWEHSGDPAALEALRRSLAFHEAFTWPDGTPVETVNDRNRYWAPSMWGHFGFSNFPNGRRYAEFLTSFYGSQPFSLEDLGRLAQNALYWHDGPASPIPQDGAAYVRQMRVPAGMRHSGPWTISLSGIVSTQAQTNQFYLDRQANFGVFHRDRGLIITGANSKRQPELATFSERFGDTENHLPVSSRLQMADSGDRLALAYNTFFAELKVPPPGANSLPFEIVVTARGQPRERQFTLQLCLKPGQFLETEGGASALLGDQRVTLSPEQIGGWIRHNGWTLKVPAGVRLEWPVRPYNPYANAPETGIEHAVGALTKTLEPKSQLLSFVLEVNR